MSDKDVGCRDDVDDVPVKEDVGEDVVGGAVAEREREMLPNEKADDEDAGGGVLVEPKVGDGVVWIDSVEKLAGRMALCRRMWSNAGVCAGAGVAPGTEPDKSDMDDWVLRTDRSVAVENLPRVPDMSGGMEETDDLASLGSDARCKTYCLSCSKAFICTSSRSIS